MRCPSCEKFVSYDDGKVDEVEVDLDEETGTVTITGRVVLPCAECGDELKELNVDETVETEDKFKQTPIESVRSCVPAEFVKVVTEAWMKKNTKTTYEWEGGDPEPEFHERTQTTVKVPIKKKGKVVGYKTKPIKSSRYMKTYKGVSVEGTLVRVTVFADPVFPGSKARDPIDFTHTVEEQASAFDELT